MSLCLWGLMTIGRLWLWRKRCHQRSPPRPSPAPPQWQWCFTAGQFTDYLLAEVQIWMLALLAASMQHVAQRCRDPSDCSKCLGGKRWRNPLVQNGQINDPRRYDQRLASSGGTARCL
jgi:hypothetical protein